MNLLPLKLQNYNIALTDKEVHVFQLFVHNHRGQLLAYENILQPGELLRASRFFKQEDRERFVIGRGILKQLLAFYTKSAPWSIEIISDQNKKPIIKDYQHLHFNVSHSKNCIVLAFSDGETGIDIEYINDDFNYKPIAETCFINREIHYLEQSTNAAKDFFKLWTRKEALLKATGKGLTDDMNKVDCLSKSYGSESTNESYKNYTIESFDIDKDYIGAVAYNCRSKKVVFYKI